MYTTHHPCWDAKNRHGLESELPFDYKYVANIFDNFEPQSQTPVKLNQTEQIEREIDAVIDKIPSQEVLFVKKFSFRVSVRICHMHQVHQAAQIYVFVHVQLKQHLFLPQ